MKGNILPVLLLASCALVNCYYSSLGTKRLPEGIFLTPFRNRYSVIQNRYCTNGRAVVLMAATDEMVIVAEGSGSPCRIKVIGVGGGGGNAVNRMIENSSSIPGVEMWVVNTDAQALSRSLAPNRLNIGKLLSR